MSALKRLWRRISGDGWLEVWLGPAAIFAAALAVLAAAWIAGAGP